MGSPVQGAMIQQLIQKMAGGGGQQGQQGQPGGQPQQGSPDAPGAAVSGQMAELNNADPTLMLRTATQVKSMLVAMYTRCAMSVPAAAKDLMKAISAMDGAIKGLEPAAGVQKTSQSPIVNNAAMTGMQQQPQPGQDSGGGM